MKYAPVHIDARMDQIVGKMLDSEEREQNEKKYRIYEIVMRMFMENGYEKTSVRDICREAGITNSWFYNFFGDKLSVLLYFDYEILQDSSRYLEPVPENLDAPYQSIYDYFLHTAASLDRLGKDLAGHVLGSTPKLLDGDYKTPGRSNTARQIARFLLTAQKRGTVPADRDCTEDAEYLMMAASGVSMYWLILSSAETYREVAARFLPVAFSAVTTQPLDPRRGPASAEHSAKD